MNRFQTSYSLADLQFDGPNISLFAGGFSGIVTSAVIMHAITSGISYGSLSVIIINSILTAYNLRYDGISEMNNRRRLKSQIGSIDDEKQNYPLQEVSGISITDSAGLEKLLERTRANEKLEWGTFFDSHAEQNNAVVDYILDSKLAEENSLITKRKKRRICMSMQKANDEGCGGFMHYHPIGGGSNFAINNRDRSCGFSSWINLLTFNMPDGPEIIGFNRRHTYIPKDKTKKELLRAGHEQILGYLAKY